MSATVRTIPVVLGFAGLLAGCIDEDLLNPMANRQPRVNYYGESDFYDDNLAMREPPAGTVPRQRVTQNPTLTTGKTTAATATTGATYADKIPVKVDSALLAIGQKRYNITCGTCHGPVGDGDSIVARQMSLRPPPSLLLYADRPPGYMFEVITNGFGLMASYAAELTVTERWAVVAYVQALQISQRSTIDKVPAGERGNMQTAPQSAPAAGPGQNAPAPIQKESL